MTGKLNILLIAASFIAACSMPIYPPTAASGDKSLPPPPRGLTAKTVSETSIELEWEGIPAAASYLVYRAAGGGEEAEYTHIAVSSLPAYTDTGLEKETDYQYKVSTTKDNAGESPLSAAVHASTKRLPPPETIVTHVVSTSRVDLEWSGVAGAAAYKVYRAAGSTAVYALLGETKTSVYTDATVSLNNEYHYKVSSIGVIGEGAHSEPYPVAIRKPDAPINISAAMASSESITVSWTAVLGVTTYKVYRGTSAGGTYSQITAQGVAGTTYTDTGLSPDTDYFYKVTAQNGIGESALSTDYAEASIRKPAAPAGLTVMGGSEAASLIVSWNEASGALSYNVYQSLSADGNYAFIISITEERTYTDTGLVMGMTYYYKVSAVNAAGESEKSDYAAAIAPSIPVPANLKASAQSASSIRLSWSAAPGASGYKLYYALTLDGEYSLAAEVIGTSYTHTGRTTGQEYFYKISSVNGAVEGIRSPAVRAIIAVPATPAGLTVEPLSANSLKISWDTVPGAKLYSVYRSTSSYVDSSDVITSTTATEYTNTGLGPFRQYYYKVSAVNDIGSGNLSAAAVSAYTQPVPLTNEVWRAGIMASYSGYYDYYSFPVTGGKYHIQWANSSSTGEANTNVRVSAYWNSGNSMTDMKTTYFTDKTKGFAAPQVIDAPDSGYIILKVYCYDYNYSIRFYK